MNIWRNYSRELLLGAVGALVGGCAFVAAPGEHPPVRPPAMPTMLPATAPAVAAASEANVLAGALARAQQRDFSGALRAIEAVAEPAARLRLQLALGMVLAEQDAATAAAFAPVLPEGPARETVLERAARVWAQREPGAALHWALDLADPAAAALARRTVANELVRTNARPTIERLLALPARAARDEVLVFAAAAWARSDADAAVGWLRELPEGRDRWVLYTAIGQTWAAVDAKAALAWARGLPVGDARFAAFAGVDTGLGVPGARRMVNGPNPPGAGVRLRGGGSVALGLLTATDTPEFLAWCATQPVGMARDEAILEFVRQRAPAAAGGLGPWVAALPGGPTRDRAMEIFVDGLLATSPATAADWLRQLPRSERNDEWVERTARQWLATNPAAAELWLREIALPPERKASLLWEVGR